jgi:hypothetical protein
VTPVVQSAVGRRLACSISLSAATRADHHQNLNLPPCSPGLATNTYTDSTHKYHCQFLHVQCRQCRLQSGRHMPKAWVTNPRHTSRNVYAHTGTWTQHITVLQMEQDQHWCSEHVSCCRLMQVVVYNTIHTSLLAVCMVQVIQCATQCLLNIACCATSSDA